MSGPVLAAMALLAAPAGTIAWTFDDGPHRHSTPHLLRLMREAGIRRSTWFVLGAQLQHPEHVKALKDIAADGHRLANHLYTHRSPCKLPLRVLLWELRRTDALLRRHAPQAMVRWYRPPFGASCHRGAVVRAGWRLVMWDVADLGSTADKMARRICARVQVGKDVTVLVHHDWRKFRDLLVLLRARGCMGRSVDDGKERGSPAVPSPPR